MPFGHRAARCTNEILCGECSQPGHNRADQQLKIPDTNTPLSTTPSTPTATSPSPPATPSPTPTSTPFPFPPAENDEMHTASEVESASGTESPAASQGKEKSRSKHTTLRFTACLRTGNSKRERRKAPDEQRKSDSLEPRQLSLSSAHRKPRQRKAKLTGREAALIAD